MKSAAVSIGQYIPGHSLLHRLDPRTKLLSVFTLMTVLLFIGKPWLLLVVLTGVAVLYLFSGFRFSVIWKSVKPILLLIAITLIMHTFWDVNGDTMQGSGLLRFSKSGLIDGIFFGLRIVILVLIAGLLSYTTAPMTLADGIYRVFKIFEKWGLPAQDLAMMISIALRFIPILFEEAQRITRAQKARGAQFSGSLLKRLKSLMPIIIPLFISTFRRANDLAVAMEVRCYQSSQSRTSLNALRMSREDWSVIAMLPCIAAVLWGLGHA